ncbi:hypothetical protein ACLBWS_03690 [Brucellaceae bacterium D45D]
MFSFQRLPGLPAYGEPALSFPNPNSFREGVVFEFNTSTGETWVGNFATGYRSQSDATGVYPHLGETAVFVVAEGCAYKINVLSKTLIEEVSDFLVWIGYHAATEAMVIVNDVEVIAYTKNDTLWKSERISWDGIESVSIQGDHLKGKAFNPFDETWRPFSINLHTGRAQGGSYDGTD